MMRFVGATVAFVGALSLLQACAGMGPLKEAELPNASFNNPQTSAKITLVLIGGNSECAGDKGLWPFREEIVDDFTQAIGSKDKRSDISTLYFSWTGDPGGHPGCLPGQSDYLEGGKERIIQALSSHNMLGPNAPPLAVVGWSNGGATATQLAAAIAAKKESSFKPVDLLVTLDPVARLTSRPENSGASHWLNVYTRSEWFNRFLFTNIIAFVGGAWNEIDSSKTHEPAFQVCMIGNHGDTKEMWSIIAESKQLDDWGSQIRSAHGGAGSKIQKNMKPERCA